MRIPVCLLTFLMTSSCFAQTEYNYFSDCFSFCEYMNVFEDGSALAVVTDFCDTDDLKTVVCQPIDGILEPIMEFQNELAEGSHSGSETCWLLTASSDAFFFRQFNENFEIIYSNTLPIPPSADVKELYVFEDAVVVCYFIGITFYISKFNLEDGSELETTFFQQVPNVGDYQSDIYLDTDGWLHVGLSCEFKFKFDPQDLSTAELISLPYSEEIMDFYNPCSNVYDLLRKHPSADTSFVVSSNLTVDDDLVFFNFGLEGDVIGFDFQSIPEEFNVVDFRFDTNGDKFLSCIRVLDSGEVGNRDLAVIRMNPAGEIESSIVIDTPLWFQNGYSIKLLYNNLWLHGSKKEELDGEDNHASLIQMNADFTSSVNELQTDEFSFVNSTHLVGVRSKGEISCQRLVDLSGRVIKSSTSATLWQKNALPNGFYILTVESANSSRSEVMVIGTGRE